MAFLVILVAFWAAYYVFRFWPAIVVFGLLLTFVSGGIFEIFKSYDKMLAESRDLYVNTDPHADESDRPNNPNL